MTVRIADDAENDLIRGARFHDSLEQGLGSYFIDSLFSDIDSLSLYAGIHAKVWGYYRLLSQRLPYAVYYSIDHDLLVIHAVLDCRQDPDRAWERLG